MVAEVVISLMERLQPPAPPIEESPIGLGEHKRHLATPVSSVGSVGGKCQMLQNTETPPPATDAVMEIPENAGSVQITSQNAAPPAENWENWFDCRFAAAMKGHQEANQAFQQAILAQVQKYHQ